MESVHLTGSTASSGTLPGGDVERLFLLGCIGDQTYAVQAASIKRVLRMAALAPLADEMADVVGLMNLHGSVLPVVDPRPRLGLPTPSFDPGQRLIVSADPRSYLLWMDRVDDIIVADPGDFRDVTAKTSSRQGLMPVVLCLKGRIIPILSLEAFNPNPANRLAEGETR